MMLLHKIISLVAFHLQFMFMALLWLHHGPWGIETNTFATTEVLTDQSGRYRFGSIFFHNFAGVDMLYPLRKK